MVPYLLKEDAFFSSITLFMIPRDFSELEEGHGYNFKYRYNYSYGMVRVGMVYNGCHNNYNFDG